jgi:hypothetical protein
MTGFQIISDVQRAVRLEAESALPNQPIQPDAPHAPRRSVVTTTRLAMTVALRRLADTLEPARSCMDTPAQAKGQGS